MIRKQENEKTNGPEKTNDAIRFKIETCPGSTILEVMQDREMRQRELAKKSGIDARHLRRLICGEGKLTLSDASGLEKAFGIPATFWATLEQLYRNRLKKAQKNGTKRMVGSIQETKGTARAGKADDTSSRETAYARIRKLPRDKQLRIAVKYYDGEEPWTYDQTTGAPIPTITEEAGTDGT